MVPRRPSLRAHDQHDLQKDSGKQLDIANIGTGQPSTNDEMNDDALPVSQDGHLSDAVDAAKVDVAPGPGAPYVQLDHERELVDAAHVSGLHPSEPSAADRQQFPEIVADAQLCVRFLWIRNALLRAWLLAPRRLLHVRGALKTFRRCA